MLDQSFSVRNFRKIFDIENRRGNYLEERFFTPILLISQELKRKRYEYNSLKMNRKEYKEEEYQSLKETIGKEIGELKELRESQIMAELEKVSSQALASSFVIGIKEVDIGSGKKAFVHDDSAASFFTMKQIQHNIRRLYKVKQSNRHDIVCQLREVLSDKFPKTIIRTDVKSFYESVSRDELLLKLNRDTLLSVSTKKLIRKMLHEYGRITGNKTGLPRGLGISAYLSELYMRDFDKSVQGAQGVVYYARYVDDIVAIICSPPNKNALEGLKKQSFKAFKKLRLRFNRDKSTILHLGATHTFAFEYLGYKFCKDNKREVILKMTKSKHDRYKKRIVQSFDAYIKKQTYAEPAARKLLLKRIRFLTGNARLVNNKKYVKAGIYFSNPHLSDPELKDLKALDAFLQSRVATISNQRLKGRLAPLSFKRGFEEKIFVNFSAQELAAIVDVWKYAAA